MASFSPFRMPEYEVPKNAMLDFSGINSALDTVNANQYRNAQVGMEQKRLGLAEQSGKREQESHEDTRRTKLAQTFAGIGQMVLEEKDPARQSEMYQRFVASDPRIKETLGKHLPKEVVDDPVVGSRYFVAIGKGYENPLDVRTKTAEATYKEALAKKAEREALQGPERYGKDIKVFQTPDGQVWGVQAGAGGELKYHKLTTPGQAEAPTAGQPGAVAQGQGGPATAPPQPLTQSRGVQQIGDELIDKSTGKPVRNVGDQIAGKEAAEERGKAAGKAGADLPRIIDNATLALKNIEQIRSHPGKEWGVGVAGVVPGIPGTQQKGFVELVHQAKGKAFLEAFNSLKGGGQITEVEGNKATQAIARLDRSQTKEDFDAALNDLEEVVNMGLLRAKRMAGTAQPSASPAGAPSGGWSIKRMD